MPNNLQNERFDQVFISIRWWLVVKELKTIISIDLVVVGRNLSLVVEHPIIMSTPNNAATENKPGGESAWLETVRSYVSSIKFGEVQIVVHDSIVVQIERTEKLRLEKRKPETN